MSPDVSPIDGDGAVLGHSPRLYPAKRAGNLSVMAYFFVLMDCTKQFQFPPWFHHRGEEDTGVLFNIHLIHQNDVCKLLSHKKGRLVLISFFNKGIVSEFELLFREIKTKIIRLVQYKALLAPPPP